VSTRRGTFLGCTLVICVLCVICVIRVICHVTFRKANGTSHASNTEWLNWKRPQKSECTEVGMRRTTIACVAPFGTRRREALCNTTRVLPEAAAGEERGDGRLHDCRSQHKQCDRVMSSSQTRVVGAFALCCVRSCGRTAVTGKECSRLPAWECRVRTRCVYVQCTVRACHASPALCEVSEQGGRCRPNALGSATAPERNRSAPTFGPANPGWRRGKDAREQSKIQ